ncbi:O-antigen ligase family protein [Halostella sp. PRR32]|uniref:O-antigen ligase family protein n=1 Tax=Halostella sp. PRR32 TaxID=3098147 RepID=UPI002B1DA7C4|nr:O-antigen ligase family protein [Halostella sp. PRR32]
MGVVYTVVVFRYGVLIEGLLSAFFVLLTFNADVPLVHGPGIAELSVYLLDFGSLGVFLLGILWYQQQRPTFSVAFRVVLASLGAFVLWSVLAALFGSGTSLTAGLMFSAAQLRYLLVFSAAGMVVYWTDVRQALYPLVIAVTGHLIVAMVQTVSGGIIGFSRLGETSEQLISTFTIGSYTIATGLHAGGFVGTGRVFIAVLLLLTPILWYAANSDARFAMATVGLGAITLLLRVSDTESGLGAFFVSALLFLLGIALFNRIDRRHYRQIGVTVLSLGMLIGLYLGNTVRAIGISLVSGLADTVQGIIRTDDTTATEGEPGMGSAGESRTDSKNGADGTDDTTATEGEPGMGSAGEEGRTDPKNGADGTDETTATEGEPGMGSAGEESRTDSKNGADGTDGGTSTDPGDSTGQPSDSGGAGMNDGSAEVAVDASNLDVRLEQYEASIDIAIENPLFGLGGWNFPLRSTQYQLPEMMAVHNTVLSHLAATGIVGALLYLTAVVTVVVHLLQNVIYGKDRRGLGIALACGIIGFQAYSFWTTVHHSTTATAVYWALCGAAVAWNPQNGNNWEH